MNPSKSSRICYPKCVICKKVRSPGSNVFLSRLPLDPLRCRHWVKAIGNIDLVYIPIEKLHELKYVCNLHFKAEDFNKAKNRLLKHAVPSQNLPCPSIADELLKEFPLHVGQDSRLRFRRRIVHINLPSTSTLSLPSTSVVNSELDPHDENINLPSTSTLSLPSTSAVNSRLDPHDENINLPSTSTLSLPSTSAVNSGLVPFGDITNTFGLKRKISNEEDERTQQGLVEVRSYKRLKKSNERKVSDSSQLTAKEEHLLKKLKETKLTLRKLTATKLDLEKLDGTVLKTLVDDAISNYKKKPHGNRWNIATKKWALSVFKRSPKTYRFIQAAVPMPSTKTLNRMLRDIDMEPGLNKAILKSLAEKTKELKERDRCFTLMFDEIALKKRLIYNEGSDKIEGFVDFGSDLEEDNRTNKMAGHALVFMIQGIGKKIKQPLAYYFVEATVPSDKLSILIKKIIVALREINIFILATVCDQGPTNVGAINLLKRFSGQPLESSHFVLNGEKVFTIYDVPHLFKSIRNNFFQAGEIIYDQKVGKWCHLIEAEQRNHNFLNFKKLNKTVVSPTYKIKMKVKYAAHALSNTMAAILKMLAWNHTQSDEIVQTAEIIEKLDQLFDCTNGPASKNDIKKGIRENVSRKTNHINKWREYLDKLDTIKFQKKDSFLQLKHVRCINGFKITLKSLIDIWHHLQKLGFRYLNLRQLNQDSLENLFGVIRQHSVTNSNPTCSHFTAALKSHLITGFAAPHSRGANCTADENKLIVNFKDRVCDITSDVQSFEKEFETPMLSLPDNYESFHEIEAELCSFEKQPVVYVSGFVASKIMKKNNLCTNCAQVLVNEHPEKDDLYKYINLREWWNDSNSLTYPTQQVCDLVSKAQILFERDLMPHLHKINIKQMCITHFMINIEFSFLNCNEHDIARQVFQIISLLFIRKYCKIENERHVVKENQNADIVKKAQQLNVMK